MDLLDQLDYNQEELPNPYDYLASSGVRFANFIIDRIANSIVSLLFGFIYGLFLNATGERYEENLLLNIVLSLISSFFYFTTMEYFLGKSVGKLITSTTVVLETGEKPEFGDIALRSLCRLIPFDAFSFLGGDRPVGWHDSLSKTLVVSDRYIHQVRGRDIGF